MERNERFSPQILITKSYVGNDINATIVHTIGNLRFIKTLDSKNNQREYLTKLWNVPQHNPNFTGRKLLLNTITNRLQQVDSKKLKPLVITACHGLGGVGKTQLTIEYIHQHVADYQMICWIPADSSEQIESAYLELAQDLGLVKADDELNDNKRPHIDEIINLVKTWFILHPTCLLIFDDVPNYQAVEKYLPQMGSHVLITSRYTEWPEEGIQVDVFELEEACEFIEKILGQHANKNLKEVQKLAETLGRLPLALAQATAYIKKNNISIERYINLYNIRKREILTKEVLPSGDHHAVVYVTWDITMKQIKKESELAFNILTACAFLHHTNIPKNLLQKYSQTRNQQQEFANEAIGTLLSYSMLNADMQNDSVSIHGLVQEIIQLKIELIEQNACLLNLFTSLKTSYPYGESQLKDYQEKRILLPHLDTFLTKFKEWQKKLSPSVNNNNFVKNTIPYEIIIRLSEGFGDIGNAKKKQALLIQALDIQNSCDKESSKIEIATILTNLGNAYGNLGNQKEKRIHLEKALEVKISIYSPGHPSIALTLCNLANAYGALGNDKKKKELLKEALQIQLNYDVNHPDNVITLGNLANVYGDFGNFEKKKELLELVLKIYERKYGTDHPKFALTLLNLGNNYGDLGIYHKQKDYLKRALKINKDYYGKDHHQVALILFNLANAYGELGNQRKRVSLLKKALKIYKLSFGQEHVNTAETLASLGDAYVTLGDLEKGKTILTDALKIKENYYENNHPMLASTLGNLGNAYWLLKDYDNSKLVLEKTLHIQEERYGKEHVKVSIILVILANLYSDMGNLYDKQILLRRALKIQKIYYGKYHLNVGKILLNLSDTYPYLMDLNSREKLLTKVLRIFQLNYNDENHPEICIVKYNLCVVYYRQGLIEKAYKECSHVYQLLNEHPDAGPKHYHTQKVKSFLGMLKPQPSASVQFANETKSLFKGIFNNESSSLNQLITKYNLTNYNQLELEKALRTAAHNAFDDDIKILLKHLKNVNAQDQKEERKSALHRAVIKGAEMCVTLLLQKGANPYLQDAYGKTSFDYAENNPIILDLLKCSSNVSLNLK